ncbi:hypothetical protein BH09PSE6_BH09PSE6_25020 [soil metagenome]
MRQIHRFGASMIVALLACSSAFGAGDIVVPTVFEEGRIFAVPRLQNGASMRLLVDTGGGGTFQLPWIPKAEPARLGLSQHRCDLAGRLVDVVDWPMFKPGEALPAPIGQCQGMHSYDAPGATEGQLGSTYLAGRIWTVDYPAQTLTLRGPEYVPGSGARAAPLGWPGTAVNSFPRVTVTIDAAPVDMLLDTGATGRPTKQSIAITGAATIDSRNAASYIVTSVLERWKRRHPDWPVIDIGDDIFGPLNVMRMIRVPAVTIAGISTGPVWFTERPDTNFHDALSPYMDKTVDGAIGGNLLRSFVMTIDYPQRKVWFVCKTNCKG